MFSSIGIWKTEVWTASPRSHLLSMTLPPPHAGVLCHRAPVVVLKQCREDDGHFVVKSSVVATLKGCHSACIVPL
jgi:hypothetical protein